MPSPAHAQIRRINLDGSGAEVVARGIRQIVGMDFSPITKQLYFTENSRDWLSEDIPEDKLNRLTQPGKDNFGYPYCHQGNIADQEFGWGHSCDEFTKPIALLGHIRPRLGCGSTPGICFRLRIATRSSSRATAPGIEPRRSAGILLWQKSKKTIQRSRSSRSLLALSRTTNIFGAPATGSSEKKGRCAFS